MEKYENHFQNIKLSLLFLATGTAYAQSTVTFTGELSGQSCSIAVESNDITVPFGTIPISTFNADGVKSVNKDFTINLTDCQDVINTLGITFTRTQIKNPMLEHLFLLTTPVVVQPILVPLFT